MPKNSEKKSFILFVINPISGDIDKDEIQNSLIQYVRNIGFLEKTYFTSGENDERQIKKLIKEFHPSIVVAVGGDGTCNLVARIIMDTNIVMGIIPLGSANGLSKELKIPKNIESSLEILGKGKKTKIDVLIINKSYISLHLSDIGTNARLVKKFEDDNVRGLFGYMKHIFSEVLFSKMLHFKVILDGNTISKKAHMVIIANASQYGTGAVVNPKGKIDDGIFEIVFIKPYTLWQLLKLIVPFFSGKLHKQDTVDVYPGRSATIINREKSIFQIDGEVIGNPEKVTVEIKHKSLNVLVPADF